MTNEQIREQARQVLFAELEKSGWQWAVFNEQEPSKNNGISECIIDAMIKFKSNKVKNNE